MDDKSLYDLISQILPDQVEQSLGIGKEKTTESNRILIESLIEVAGKSGDLVEKIINQFLNGEGELLETTRAAVERGNTTAKNEVAAFLENKFNLSPTVAELIASLVIKLFPSISKLTGESTTKKKKPRKKKPKTSSTSAQNKPKKKKSTSKPKPTAKKPAAKKKSTAKGSNQTTTKKKPKKTRTTTMDQPPAES